MQYEYLAHFSKDRIAGYQAEVRREAQAEQAQKGRQANRKQARRAKWNSQESILRAVKGGELSVEEGLLSLSKLEHQF